MALDPQVMKRVAAAGQRKLLTDANAAWAEKSPEQRKSQSLSITDQARLKKVTEVLTKADKQATKNNKDFKEKSLKTPIMQLIQGIIALFRGVHNKKKSKQFQDKLDDIVDNIARLSSAVDEGENRLQDLLTAKDDLNTKIGNIQDQIANLQEQLNDPKTSPEKKASLEHQLAEKGEQLKEAQEDLKELDQAIDSTKSEISDLKDKINDEFKELSDLVGSFNKEAAKDIKDIKTTTAKGNPGQAEADAAAGRGTELKDAMNPASKAGMKPPTFGM